MTDHVVSDAPLRGMKGVLPPAPEWFEKAVNAPFESGRVAVEGATIAYRAWGERGKPGLLLLHGNSAHLGWWSFLAPLFASDFRVVCPDFSGMGESDWRPERYRVDQYAREALAAGAAAGADMAGPPIVVGHSLGGQPVVHAAAHMPERIRAGVMVDTGFPGPEMTAEIPSIRSEHPSYPDLAFALDRFRLSPPQPCEHLYIADYVARMALRQAEDGSWTWRFDRTLWRGLEFGDPWTDLANARVPMAMLRGERSNLTNFAMGKRMRATAPAGTIFADIPEAYHHVMIDQPLALVASLRILFAAWD